MRVCRAKIVQLPSEWTKIACKDPVEKNIRCAGDRALGGNDRPSKFLCTSTDVIPRNCRLSKLSPYTIMSYDVWSRGSRDRPATRHRFSGTSSDQNKNTLGYDECVEDDESVFAFMPCTFQQLTKQLVPFEMLEIIYLIFRTAKRLRMFPKMKLVILIWGTMRFRQASSGNFLHQIIMTGANQ